MSSAHFVEVPAIEGPDYVALVIEWDDIDDAEDTIVREPLRSSRAPLAVATVVGALGALGVLALATWGVRRLIWA